VGSRSIGQTPDPAADAIPAESASAPRTRAVLTKPAPAAARPLRAEEVPASRLRQTFVALEQRDFRIFWLGQLVSVTGTWMQTVAQGWLILELTGSPFVLGLAAAARSLPVLLLVVPAGIVADRFDRRRIILATSVVATLASALMGILAISGLRDVAPFLVVAGVLGVSNAFEMPARQSYVSELIGRRHLANAIALNSLLFNAARVVGPAIAGVLVALVGPGWAFVINAVSFVPVMIGLILISHVHVPRAFTTGGAIPEAIRYLRSEPRVTALLGLLGAQTIFASGQYILGPSLAQDLGQGAEGLGVLLAASGAGAVVGGLRLAATSDRAERWRLLLLAALALGAGLIGVGLTKTYAITLICFVVAGWGLVTFNASTNTLMQMIVPDRLRGRIMSLYTLMLLGLVPVGGVLLGALASQFGSAAAVALGGVVYSVIVVAAFALVRSLRRV
jgi:MFS family permease